MPVHTTSSCGDENRAEVQQEHTPRRMQPQVAGSCALDALYGALIVSGTAVTRQLGALRPAEWHSCALFSSPPCDRARVEPRSRGSARQVAAGRDDARPRRGICRQSSRFGPGELAELSQLDISGHVKAW